MSDDELLKDEEISGLVMPEVDASRRTRSATTSDTKALIRTIIATAIGIAALLLTLIGLVLQQNAAVNARIDDVNTNVNARINDVNASVNARIDDLNASMNARFDDLRSEMNRRLDSLQADVRELRVLLTDALKGGEPAD